MRQTLRCISIFVGLVGLTLLLAACGGSASSSASATPQVNVTATIEANATSTTEANATATATAMPSPMKTFTTFCDALKRGDYQMAYNQLSSRVKARGTESQFAANLFALIPYIAASGFPAPTSGTVTDCTGGYDTSGGQMTITFSNGSITNTTFSFKFIQESPGVWKIDF